MARFDNVKKILVITLSNVGDVILTTPVISCLRQEYPESEITVLAGEKTISILMNSRTIQEVIPYNKHASWLRKILLVFKLRAKKFDLVADLRNKALPLLIGARYRTAMVPDRKTIPMRARHLSQIRELVSTIDRENCFDFFSQEEDETAMAKYKARLNGAEDKAFVVVVPGARSSLKRWTVKGFAWLVQYLYQRGKTVVLVGNEKDIEEELMSILRCPVVNLFGALTLRELSAIVHHAEMVVCNDSGVMHLTSELKRPVVCVYGPTSEEICGPRGSHVRIVRKKLDCAPCDKAECVKARRECLDDLPVEDVISACEELFESAANHAV